MVVAIFIHNFSYKYFFFIKYVCILLYLKLSLCFALYSQKYIYKLKNIWAPSVQITEILNDNSRNYS